MLNLRGLILVYARVVRAMIRVHVDQLGRFTPII